MSVSLNGSGHVRRTASSLDYQTDYTLMGWVYLDSIPSFAGIACIRLDSNNDDDVNIGSSAKWQIVEHEAGVYNIALDGTFTVSTATWYHLALVRSGNQLTAYYGTESVSDVIDPTATGSPAGRGASVNIELGSWADLASRITGRLYHWAAWQSALTLAQINAQRTIWPPTQATPWAYWALAAHTDLTDGSGNGRDLSASGSGNGTAADPTFPPVGPAAPVYNITATVPA